MLRRGGVLLNGRDAVHGTWIALAVSRHCRETWSAVVRAPVTVPVAKGDAVRLEFENGETRNGRVTTLRRDRMENMVLVDGEAGWDDISPASATAGGGLAERIPEELILG